MAKQRMKSHLDRLDKLQFENDLLRKLATKRGFINVYYSNLKNFDTNTECFDFVNDLHKKHFGEHKYMNYNSFRVLKNREL